MKPRRRTAATRPDARPDPAAVLTKAVLRAARSLEMSQKELAGVLGISEASASRLSRGRTIEPAAKEGELALLFLRVFRSLDALLGGREGPCRGWLRSENAHLGGRPAELILGVRGLVHVAEYLDGMRGRL